MNRTFKIGDLEFKNPFLLAPLAGFTDKTMRTLCAEQGASLTYTEMVSCKGLKYGDKKSDKLLEIGPDEGPVAFQVFGSDLFVMEDMTEYLCDGSRGNVLIDLNSGCPVPKIVKNGEGSALLKKLDQLYDVVAAMVRGSKTAAKANGLETPIPVTVKMRMGFAKGTNVAVQAAKAVEEAGAAAVTIHGRTREQYYEGKADWTPIADVKVAVRIPVIGNGDVMKGEDALRMMDETGCDAVMIARGALGNPWIFRDACALLETGAKPDEPTSQERIDMLLRHLNMLVEDKGEYVAVREIRKFINSYTKGMHGAAAIRRELNTMVDMDKIKESLKALT